VPYAGGGGRRSPAAPDDAGRRRHNYSRPRAAHRRSLPLHRTGPRRYRLPDGVASSAPTQVHGARVFGGSPGGPAAGTRVPWT